MTTTSAAHRDLGVATRAPRVNATVVPLATIGALAAAQGGYFPTSWGWAALVLLWLSAATLVAAPPGALSVLQVAFLATTFALGAWIAASIVWSADPAQSVSEVQRFLVYASGLLALTLLARRHASPTWAAGLFVVVVALAAYGLATRLFPDKLGVYDSIGTYRLSEPVGYWNGLGILVAMGLILSFGLASHWRSVGGQALAGACLPLLLTTLYFTFSRGAWIALVIGALTMIAVDPRRLRLTATVLVLTPMSAAAVYLAARADALTHQRSLLSEAVDQGASLAASLAALVLVAGIGAGVLGWLDRAVTVSVGVRVAYVVVLVLVVGVLIASAFERYGGPVTIAQKARNAFSAPAPELRGDLNRRLFSFSGNGRAELWRVAWQNYRDHPYVGSGAGTYERAWLRDRPRALKVRDAHGLYIETLSELGPPGLALLLATICLPLGAALRYRRAPLIPAMLGAYCAYVVHAGVDWDWELSGVTLAALLCGAVLVAGGKQEDAAEARTHPKVRAGLLAFVALLVVAAFVGLMGASALSAGREALAKKDAGSARSEASRAALWMRWSPEPWLLLGDTYLSSGEFAAARVSYQTATRRDRHDWRGWLGLAKTSTGRSRDAALGRAQRLNPHSPEIARERANTGTP